MHEERMITVNKDRLLETLHKNRETHKQEYLEALAGYKEAMAAQLQENLDRLQNTDKDKEFHLEIRLSAPTHNLDDYDRYITMFEWELEEEVDLSATEVHNLIQDKWHWTNNFKSIHSLYTSVHK